MFWDREKLLSVTVKPKPKYHDRIIDKKDNYTIVDDKNGEKITLEEHKRKYPYKIDKDFICYVKTTHRKFSFTIPVDYCWNGADIPRVLWFFVGSKDNPEFKVPSCVHDFLLEFRGYIYKNILREEITVSQYRRLTSLIFRELLKQYGTKTVKSNIMASAVAGFQFLSPQWRDMDNEKT